MRLFLLPVACLLLGHLAIANVIPMDVYLNSVKNNDLFLKSIQANRSRLEFKKDLKSPDSAWILSITDQYGISSDNDSDTHRFTGQLSKTIPSTGTELTLQYNDNKLADREEQVKTVQLEQSLLKNAFGYQGRLVYEDLNEEDRRIYLQLVEDYEDYLAERIKNYLAYLSSYEDLKLAKKQLNEARSLFKEINERRKKSIARKVDVDRSLAEVLDFQNSVIEAEMNFSSAEIKLSEGLGEIQLAKVKTFEVPFYSRPIQETNDSSSLANSSRVVQLKESELKSSQIAIDLNENDLWPELKFLVGLSEDESSRFGTAVNRRESFFGLSFEYKFDDSIKRAELAQSEFSNRKRSLELNALKDQVQKQIRDSRGRVEKQKERLEIYKKQVEVLSRLYSEEQRRFRRGRVDLETLIEVKNRLSRARTHLISQKVEVAKVIVDYKALTDSLVEKL